MIFKWRGQKRTVFDICWVSARISAWIFCWKFCIISWEKKSGLSICGLLLSGFSLVSRVRPRKHVPLLHTLLKSTAWMNSQVFETNLN